MVIPKTVIYPENFEAKIGFSTIREQVVALCTMQHARELLASEAFTNVAREVERRHALAEEMRQILLTEREAPTEEFYDIAEIVEKTKVEGTFLEVAEVVQLGRARQNTEIRLLQLTDTQIIDATQCRTEDRLRPEAKAACKRENIEIQCYSHIRSLVAQSNPDLIFISGDVIYGEFDDSGEIQKEFIDFMDNLQIPWTLVFGNHDNETVIGVEKQCELYVQSKYCLFRRGNVSGNSNFTIGIACGGELKRVLYMLDSNGCKKSSEPSVINKPGIFPDQLEEMRKKASCLKLATGKTVPGFMVFHIPVDCFEEAQIAKGYCKENDVSDYIIGVNVAKADDDFGFKLEPAKHLKYYISTDKEFKETLKHCGIDGVFVGHFHKIATCITYDSIKWVHGLKTGQYDFHAPGQLGGTLITLTGGLSNDFKVQHIPSLVPHGGIPKGSRSYQGFFVE